MKRLVLHPLPTCGVSSLGNKGKIYAWNKIDVFRINTRCFTSHPSNKKEDEQLHERTNTFDDLTSNHERFVNSDRDQRNQLHDVRRVRERYQNRGKHDKFNKIHITNNIEPLSRQKMQQLPRQEEYYTYNVHRENQNENANQNAKLNVQVPKSLDISEVESRLDVEKYFPSTIAHLKSPPHSSFAAENADERMWNEATHEYDADGIRIKPSANSEEVMEKEHSFFDQGSLDIRGGVHDAVRQRRPSRLGARVGLPQTQEQKLSPDILQLTGGSLKRDGAFHLTSHSNDAPADDTIEVNEDDFTKEEGKCSDNANSEFGDTPVELTDMLRERLMELKRDKLHEERHETYMPRRLNLLSDAEVDARMLSAAHEQRKEQEEEEESKFNATPVRASNINANHTLESLLHSESHTQQQENSEWNAQEQVKMKENTTPFHHVKRASLADLSSSSTFSNSKIKSTTLKENTYVNDDHVSSDSAQDNDKSELAIHRDGISFTAARDALRLLSGASSYIPGANTESRLHNLTNLPEQACEPIASDGSGREGGVHLLRTLPRAGFCSRREAGVVVSSGQVLVNRVVERNPFRVIYAQDDIHVSGHSSRLRFAAPRLWIYHKPANVLVSRNDPAGRRLITRHARILGFDHLIPIGSLPLRAHGVLLLTNDGELARFLEHPSSMVQQTYLLRVRPAIDAILAHKLNTEGVNINGKQYHNLEFIVNPSIKSRFSLKIKVRGEVMPISHLLQHLGRVVERGGRVSFGPFALGWLAVGSIREVTVPPFYIEHVGHIWKPFIERDWPFFRRLRVARLRRLSRYRELSAKEVEELENFTFDELSETLSFESSEMASVAAKRAEEMRRRPVIHEEAISSDFMPINGNNDIDVPNAESSEARSWFDEEPIIEDITTFA